MNPRQKKIAELWDRGQSSGEIAKNLRVSRSTVMGVIHRLRISGIKLANRAPHKVSHDEETPMVKRAASKPRTPVAKPEPVQPPMTGNNCTFEGLTVWSCRFIIGPVNGLNTVYCGEPKTSRFLCDEHHKLCYIPLKRTEPATLEP